jgi:UDP-N-acetylmuramate--alanine ligase
MTGRIAVVSDESALWALEPGAHIHLVGIGGIGLSAIARILLQRGYVVSGSDMRLSPITRELVSLGAAVHEGHRRRNIGDADAVIVSSAIRDNNPEVVAAGERSIPVLKRGQALAWLMKGRYGIAVAGTHGKTTVSALIGLILSNAGADPTIIVGGIVPELGTNARDGKGRYFVVEADEYDRTFLHLSPQAAVVTSIEMDHPDCYADLPDLSTAFSEFLARVPPDGFVMACGDDPQVKKVAGALVPSRVSTYGLGPDVDWRAVDLQQNALGGTDFRVMSGQEQMGWFQLSIPGNHNVSNALAAIGIAHHLDLDPAFTRDTLRDFQGVARRFEVKGECRGVTVIDDYAHHPSEVRATLAGARRRYPGRRIWAIFQPHTYSRTKTLLAEFGRAFDDADRVIVTEIYAARENDTLGIESGALVQMMSHPGVVHIPDHHQATSWVCEHLTAGDVVITMGAGDIWEAGEELLALLAAEGRQGAVQAGSS